MTRPVVVMFPGVNCERETALALHRAFAVAPRFCRHDATALPADAGLVVLPGGFSYGDHLRGGAIAARAPIMTAVRAHAAAGGRTLGICNGFQILAEAGLLPGRLVCNASGRFVHRSVRLRVANPQAPFLHHYEPDERIVLPIAHHEGAWHADEAARQAVADGRLVALRYEADDNPNGSLDDIAGLTNPQGNVLGLMPHPERAAGLVPGHSTDGLRLFLSLAEADTAEADACVRSAA